MDGGGRGALGKPFRAQLLKWVGNKQKQADAIIAHFPQRFGTYFEPFLGSGGVLGVLSPRRAFASDGFLPLIEIWRSLLNLDFAAAMSRATRGDLVYCDPPYRDSQTILYGAQSFSLDRLLDAIARCKSRGARVALSIDGTKFSGRKICDVPVPEGLFMREQFIAVGRSMLKRFQMDGRTLEAHEVSDRLLLTY